MLEKIFERKGEGVTEGCRKVSSEELHNLYSSPNIMTTSKFPVRNDGKYKAVLKKQHFN
jgi:hypothetical protein